MARQGLVIKEDGKRMITPMFIVIITLGTTDLLFALDSIPAIFGITKEPYLVLTANIFALMGLRQLYFLIGGLLQRLIYLSYGLAFLLAFIGVKLILHAMHENELSFINGGEHIEWAPEIPIWLSLVVILATLAVTAVLSLWASSRMTPRSRTRPPARAATGKTTDRSSRPAISRSARHVGVRRRASAVVSGQVPGHGHAEVAASRRCSGSAATAAATPRARRPPWPGWRARRPRAARGVRRWRRRSRRRWVHAQAPPCQARASG